MVKRLFTPERNREFVRRYEEGESAYSIARSLGLAMEKYEAGASLNALAREIGTSPSIIRSRLERRGVTIRAPRKFKAEHHSWKGGRSLDRRSGYVKIRI